MALFTAHGSPIGNNITAKGSSYFKDIMENPSLENIMKNIVNIQKEEDEEFKEIKTFISEVMKEDLKMETPFELMTYSMKFMFKGEEERNQEMKEIAEKITERVQRYYLKKMAPIMQEMMRE